jgi:hypothetical protein
MKTPPVIPGERRVSCSICSLLHIGILENTKKNSRGDNFYTNSFTGRGNFLGKPKIFKGKFYRGGFPGIT